MKRLFSIMVIVFALAVSGAANALPLEVIDTGDPIALQLNRTWTGTVAGTLDGAGVNWYTGYGFNFTFNGTTYQEPTAFCIDPADATLAVRSDYYIISLSSLLQSDSASQYNQYFKAAYLADQAIKGAISTVAAQAAIWEIMFSTYDYSSDSRGDSATFIDSLVEQAGQNYANYDLNGFYIAASPSADLSASFGVDSQDYLFKDTAPVPEPTTMILLGTGLLGLAGLRKKTKE